MMGGQLRSALSRAGQTESSKFRVLARITNVGEHYGFADVSESIDGDGPQTGQNIYLVQKVCEVLAGDRGGSWGIGDTIVLSVAANGDSEHVDQTPWVGIFAHTDNSRSVRQLRKPAERATAGATIIASKLTEQAKAIIVEANEAELTSDQLKADAEFAKAFADLKSAMTEGRDDKARSAIGRMRVRVTDLLVPAAIGAAMKAEVASLDELLAS